MGSLQFQGEKQLFERFWKGTFKAVATPRPGSVIVASITARKRVINTETSTSLPLTADERKVAVEDTRVADPAERRRCIRDKGRKHGSHRRTRSSSFEDHGPPRPAAKGKKKKRKSERKRKRKRSPSCSLSPVRKKKKKKKKRSSKKSKRHRYSSKKTKHSSSSLKHKRKDDRKHNKSSRSHSHRRRRYRRSESESSIWRSSSMESRHHLPQAVGDPALGGLAALREDSGAALDQRGFEWGPAVKSVCKAAPNYRSILSTGTMLQSKPGGEIVNPMGIHHHTLSRQSKPPQDYDSGNDTSSPPSTKTGASCINVISNKKVLSQALASPEKLKFADGDNTSDSGNSVTSYASLCKPLHVDGGLSTSILNRNGKREVLMSGGKAEVRRPQKCVVSPVKKVSTSRKRTRAHSSSSRSSRSRSSGSSRHSGRCSRSRSLSSDRSYSRSTSFRRKGSVGSGRSRCHSYSRYSPDRVRERRRKLSSCEKDAKSSRKRGGKRRRRKSYSPMRKRRRDSPSHLEARRITSARKRPIPYFRPSPSSSSRSTSVSSWSSLFTRSRSPSPCLTGSLCRTRTKTRSRSRSQSRSRGRSRSHSYSSYSRYSRSSSWNSAFSSRSHSRSRSYVSLCCYSKSRR